MTEFLAAATPVAISIAIIAVCLTVMGLIAAVVFGGCEVETGGKFFTMKVTKRGKLPSSHTTPQTIEIAAEPGLPIPRPSAALVHEPVGMEAEPASGEAQEQAEDESDVFWKWFSAKTLSDLDAAATSMLQSLKHDAEEFWRTEHLRRREALGAYEAREAMRQLAVDNPAWAMPHAVMLDWSIADHDYTSARVHMDAGLKRVASPQFGHVISSGVHLIYKFEGRQSALAFALLWSKAASTDAMRAAGLFTLAQLLKDAGDTDGGLVASEYANVVHPAASEFNLAYAYSRSSSRWAMSMWHYMRDINDNDQNAIATNNIGVLYSQLDKALAIKTYEQASADGDKYAPANLAHLLIADGYPKMALALLNAVEDTGSAAENHASARSEALAAQRRIDDKAIEVKAAMEAIVEPYRASLASALRFLQDQPSAAVIGIFASANRDVVAEADGSKIRCQIRAGAKVYEGTLQNQITCFTGWLSTSGASILNQEVAEFTLLNEGGGILRLFRWPASSGLNANFASFELRKVKDQPQLAPPPDNQVQGLLASILQHPTTGAA